MLYLFACKSTSKNHESVNHSHISYNIAIKPSSSSILDLIALFFLAFFLAYNCVNFSEHMKQIKMLSMSFGNAFLIIFLCFLYSEEINKTDMLPFRNTLPKRVMELGEKRLPGYRELRAACVLKAIRSNPSVFSGDSHT